MSYSSTGATEHNLYGMTLSQIMSLELPFNKDIYLKKVKYQASLVYSGQALLDFLYGLSKKMRSGYINLLNQFYVNSAYIDMAKQYLVDRLAEETITQAEYDILHGLLDNTLPTQ